jgi:dihydrolipoamide dehydrogenase
LFRSYGAEVTLLEMLPRLLPNEDEAVSHQLERSFRAQGIDVRPGVAVSGLDVRDDDVSVKLGANNQVLQAERVLVGVGFEPNADGLGLEEAGVERKQGWIKIDGYCRTNVPGIWAIGDVTGALLLAHVAAAQGVCAVEMMAGRHPAPLDYETMPRAVYCQPEAASLGLTEAAARGRGLDVAVGRFPLAANAKALAVGDTEGFVKVVADRSSGALIGFHAIGHNATELLGEASLARLLESTHVEIGLAVHAHPTISEALREAALAVSGDAVHFYSQPR